MRKTFAVALAAAALTGGLWSQSVKPGTVHDRAPAASDGAPVLRLGTHAAKPEISFLSWDTEGGHKARTNLLRPRAGIGLWFRAQDGRRPTELIDRRTEREGVRYRLGIAGTFDGLEVSSR